VPFSLDVIEQDVLDFLVTTVFPGQEVVEEAIPDIQTLKRTATGAVNPYVVVQLGDPQPWGSYSFMGPRGDDYSLPVYIQIVVPKPSIGRSLRSRAIDLFLGASFEWAGEVRKRVSGGQFPIKNSDGAVEAYLYPASFGLLIQLHTITTP